MQRRMLILASLHISSTRNRSIEIGAALRLRGGWSVTVGDHPSLGRYDVIWVLDPMLAKEIGGASYRLLVWERDVDIESRSTDDRLRREGGALILDHCANLIFEAGRKPEFRVDGWRATSMAKRRRASATCLDAAVARELAEEIISVWGDIETPKEG